MKETKIASTIETNAIVIRGSLNLDISWPSKPRRKSGSYPQVKAHLLAG